MSKESIRIECMSEILDELGINLSHEQIAKIVRDFSHVIDFEHEMSSYGHINKHPDVCQKCKTLEAEISRLKNEIEIYQNSVKKRRHTDEVWIEGNDVIYGEQRW